MQRKEILVRKLQSAITYVEIIHESYQSKEPPLEIGEALREVVGMLQEIRREVLRQELTRVLHNEALPEAVRNKKVGKIFKSLV